MEQVDEYAEDRLSPGVSHTVEVDRVWQDRLVPGSTLNNRVIIISRRESLFIPCCSDSFDHPRIRSDFGGQELVAEFNRQLTPHPAMFVPEATAQFKLVKVFVCII